MHDLSKLPPARRGSAPALRPVRSDHPAAFWGPRKRRTNWTRLFAGEFQLPLVIALVVISALVVVITVLT